MTKSRISIIVALTSEGVIGKRNDLPWPRIPADMKYFKETTMGHPVIMGRKTWESIPEKFRPLPGRVNIVLSKDPTFEAGGAFVFPSLESALTNAAGFLGGEEIFIIGGAQIYAEALPKTGRLYLTYVHRTFEGDTYFRGFAKDFKNVVSSEERHDTDPPITFVVVDR